MWIEKHGRSYRIRDTVAGRKVTLKGDFPSKTSAKTYMINLLADRSRGEYIDPRSGQARVQDWLDIWWPGYSVTLKPSSRISADGILRRYIRPEFGDMTFDEVDHLAVQMWVAAMAAGKHRGARKPLSVKTIRNAHGLAHKVFAEAVKQRLIRANPFEHTGLPERLVKEMRFLTEPEAERLLAAVATHYRPLVLLMLATGLRFGEAIGLRVGRVDVLACRLVVVETLQTLAGPGGVVFVSPKSRMSRRTVTFPKNVSQELVPLVASKDGDDLVFRAPKGGTVRYSVFRKMWVGATIAAGLDGLRVHDLRHTHAAWLISANVPLTAVSRRLGHASISVTSDMYGHLLPAVDEGIISTIDKALPARGLGGMLGEMGADSQGLARIDEDSAAGQTP